MADTQKTMQTAPKPELNIREDYEARYGFSDPEDYFHKSPKGVSHSRGLPQRGAVSMLSDTGWGFFTQRN